MIDFGSVYSLAYDVLSSGGKLLNVGSGRRPIVGAINLDIIKNLPGLQVVGSVLALPFKNSAFDAVVFEAIPSPLVVIDDFQALKEIFRVLKPGGKMAISTHNAYGFGTGMVDILKDIGFSVIEVDTMVIKAIK